MYTYQKTNRYFAQVADDIKEIAEKELKNLGAENTSPAYRGIYFTATPEILYSINFKSRLISRVLAPLVSFTCHSDKVLYKKALQIQWEDFFDPSMTFAVFSSVSHSVIRHSKFAALRLKDAIADYFREKTGKRPSIDTINPDVWINLHIQENKASISLDTSGGSLHRRGYRIKTVEAPMIETLAAAIITYSEWNGTTTLNDPFCGSGTILCESFIYASGTPAGVLRKKFGFERLPDFNPGLWKKVKTYSMNRIKSLKKGIITGSDISPAAIQTSMANCALLDKDKVINIKRNDVFNTDKINESVIVCNPPYGIRLNDHSGLEVFYKRYGDFLKQRCTGSVAFIYFGERKYIKNIGLKASWKKPLSNGGLDGRLVKYELY